MDPLLIWKLSDAYSVMHAALLMAGHLPQDIEAQLDYEIEVSHPGYIAARTVLLSAISSKTIVPVKDGRSFDMEDGGYYGDYDPRLTLLSVSDLNRFVTSKGFRCEAFERNEPGAEPALDSASAFYSVKLNAANRAWQAISSNPSLLIGKSPKQALRKWLREHASDLGLLNKDGQPNGTGIEEICKVANWKPKGGATPTPSAKAAPSPERFIDLLGPKPQKPASREKLPWDLDDETPF